MIILLHGQDTWRSKSKLLQLKQSFSDKKQGDVIEIDAADFSLRDLKNHLFTTGLFSKNKLIILKDFLTEVPAKELEKIEKLLNDTPSETNVIFFERSAIDKRNKFFKTLLKLSKNRDQILYPEFTIPNTYELKRWISDRLKKSGQDINPDALNLLAESCDDTWQAALESDKLIAYPENPITLEHLKNLVTTKVNDNIFDLTDALGNKKLNLALQLLNDQLSIGTEPIYLLSMITRQIRILIKMKSATKHTSLSPQQLAATTREHPYVIKKSLPTAKLFTEPKLLEIYEKILETDKQLKSSRLSPNSLLAKLIFDIIN